MFLDEVCWVACLQLGAAWFDTVARELSSGAYGTQAGDTFFQHSHDRTTAASEDRQWAARAVLVDMEPKVSPRHMLGEQQQGWGSAGVIQRFSNYV